MHLRSASLLPHKRSELRTIQLSKWNCRTVTNRIMLKISRTSTIRQIALSLEGEVNGRWVEELRDECDRVLWGDRGGSRKVVLDLANVSSIDATGLELFKELIVRGVAVANCSPYVAELLRDVIDADQ